MIEETQTLIVATLWLIVHEVADNAALTTVAGIVASVGFALYIFMVATDLWLLWRRNRRRGAS